MGVNCGRSSDEPSAQGPSPTPFCPRVQTQAVQRVRPKAAGSNTDLFHQGGDFLLCPGHLLVFGHRPTCFLALTSRKPFILVEFRELSYLFGLGLGGCTDVLFILRPTQSLRQWKEKTQDNSPLHPVI